MTTQLTQDEIRAVFMRNGFTIKDGQTDLKDYVYLAARELIAAHEAKQAQGEAVQIDFDWPDYHYEAMGCGLEDRGIADRYEAMRYGWDSCLDRCAEAAAQAVEALGPLYTRPQQGEDAVAHEPCAKLISLADRIDHEKLWQRPGTCLFDGSLTQDQRDRLNAGVSLRRYADLLGSDGWRIYPPKPGLSFRAATLEAVVAMARKHAGSEQQGEDARDAGRYRQLRRGQKWSVVDGIGGTLRAEELDAAIDAAIAASTKGGEA